MIEITALTKRYSKNLALDNISFSIAKGEIVGFLGPNGAGKSTTMNIITGYLSSTSGSVMVDGFDILDNPNEVKKRVGYLPEIPPLYVDMTVQEYLDFVFDLKKIKGINKQEHIAEIVEKVGIENVYKRRISHLSKGYRQRVGLAQALLGNPEVLILDEPTVGLDPKQIIEIRNVIKELGKEHTVILSSHILSEISAVCERVIIIKNGRIVAEDTPENLSKQFGGSMIELKIGTDASSAVAVIEAIDEVESVVVKEDSENECMVEVSTTLKDNTEFSKALFFKLAENGMPILMQNTVRASLEDVFIELTENDIPEMPEKEPLPANDEEGAMSDESDI